MFSYDPNLSWHVDPLEGHWCPSLTGPTGLDLWDASEENNRATLVNFAAASAWTLNGPGGYCLDFNGSSHYVAIPHRPNLSLTVDLTLSAWVRPTSSAASDRIIVSKNSGTGVISSGGTTTYELYLTGLQLKWWDGQFEYATGVSLAINEWSHVAATRSGSTLTIYVNGSQVYQTTVTNLGGANTSEVWIGRDTSGQYFLGQMDDVRIFSRSMVASEIQRLASRRGFGVGKGPAPRWGKRAWWRGVSNPMASPLVIVPRGRKVGPAIFDRRRKRLLEGLSLYYSPAITGPTGLDLLDLSGQNINGILTGMDAPSDWVLTGPGYALDFDGVNDQVTASTPFALTTYPFTLSGWAYLPTTIPNTNGAIICSVGLGATQYFAIGVQTATPRPRIFARNTTFIAAGPTTGTYGGDWALITGVFASAKRRDLYYNGIFVGTSTTSVPEITANSSVRIGSAFNQLYFNASVSEVIIHRRELQVGEIGELYDLGNGGLGRTPKRNFLVTPVPSTGNRRRRIICRSY